MADKAIWLGGLTTNPSEFADTVIAHEYGHHTAAALNFTTPLQAGTPNTHMAHWRIAPYLRGARAWPRRSDRAS